MSRIEENRIEDARLRRPWWPDGSPGFLGCTAASLRSRSPPRSRTGPEDGREVGSSDRRRNEKSRRRMSRAASRPRKVERLLTRLEGDHLRDEVTETPEITQIPELHAAIGARLRARDWGGRERFRTMARHGCAAEDPTTHAAQRAPMGASTGELPRADVESKLDRRLHGESLDKTKRVDRQEEKSSRQKEISTESCDLNRVLSRSRELLVRSPSSEPERLSSAARPDRASCARTRAPRTRPARCSRRPVRPT